MKNRIRINGTLMSLCILIALVFSHKFFRKDITTIDYALEIIGIILLLLGQLIRISSRGYKSEHSKSGGILLTSGPYAVVRNPMYLGIFLMGLGIVLCIFQYWVFVCFFAYFTFRYLMLISQEEKFLAEKFGQQFKDYQKNTPKLLPRINFFIGKSIRDYLPIKPQWFKRELTAFIPILVVIIGIKFWVATWK